MIGSICLLMTALLQLNFGLNVANQGYPSSTSLCPISVTRNHISLWIPLVHTSRSRKWVIIPDLLIVLSILKLFFGVGSSRNPNPICLQMQGA
jgi:hypothetical protein